MNTKHFAGRSELSLIAAQAMVERGLEPDFPIRALHEVQAMTHAGDDADPRVVDLTALAWCSIDNDDSRDLDQLTVAESLPNGDTQIYVAVADVDVLVPKGSALDAHAQHNTASVYTSTRVFPMLPERLCTDLTSLNPHVDRLAVVVEMCINTDAQITHHTLYRAKVRNQAKLAYDAVSDWLEGDGVLPEAAAIVQGMAEQLHVQDSVAQLLRTRRRAQGALEFETLQAHAVFEGERVVALRQQVQNRARQLRPTPARHIFWRRMATRRCAVWCARPSGGNASWLWPPPMVSICQPSPTRRRLKCFWPNATSPTRCALWICLW